jgi:DNA repair exonuclease SbcCD ATPase subunit
MARDEMFKTVSFGGYDKAVVEEYVAETNRVHQNDIADLKTTIGKLSETVRSLQLAKEQVKSAASEDIEKLKMELESSFEETDQVKRQLEEKNTENADLRQMLGEKDTQLVDVRQELEDVKRSLAQTKEDLEQEKQVFEQTQSSSLDRVAALEVEKEHEADAIRTDYETRIRNLVEEQEAHNSRLQSEKEEALAGLRAEYEEKLAGLRTEQETQLASAGGCQTAEQPVF